MDKAQKKTLWFLIAVGLVYFCLMIPVNLTGAKNAEMLSVFEIDEFAQYEHVLRMVTPGSSIYQSLRNFFVYLHYFYGFPFYFFSALSLLPLKLFSPDWPANTQLIICWLRQFINVLPMILSAGIFTWLMTRFKKCILSLALFLLLLTVPAVLINNFWWHPDSLSLFFIGLVFYFLDRDDLRFGKNFYLAAAACGYATGIKYHGLFFGLTIPVLLLWGLRLKRLSVRQMLGKGFVFILIMALFFVLSNPLLLLPQERAEIIRTQQLQFEQTGFGTFTVNRSMLQNGSAAVAVTRENYAEIWFFVLALGGLIFGFQGSRQQRLVSVLMLTYLTVALGVTLNAATSRLHYFLPVAVPLFANAAALFHMPRKRMRRGQLMFLTLALMQFGRNLAADVPIYQDQLNRESTSASIQFYSVIEREILPDLRAGIGDKILRVSKDWKIYFPQQEQTAVQMDWDMLTLAAIEEWNPDLILLENENVELFSEPDILTEAVNPEKMEKIQQFYTLAAENQLLGYSLASQNRFGSAYIRIEKSSNE